MATPAPKQDFMSTMAGGGPGAIVDAAATIANTVAGINDMNQRRKFEFNLAMLNNDQQLALAKQLQSTNNQNTRLQMLTNAMIAYRMNTSDGILKKESTKIIILAATALVSLGILAYTIKR